MLRHLIESDEDFHAFRKHLLKINGGEGRGKAFTDRGYNKMLQFYADLTAVGIAGITLTELYTLLMSP